jgi:hypothetical protein
VSHPARFSKEVVDTLVDLLQSLNAMDRAVGHRPGLFIHDPFAGTGERLYEIASRLDPPARYSGVEIEPEFIVMGRTELGFVCEGDATNGQDYPASWPDRPYIIVTSPAYPNGMADSWAAQDPSKRKNYRKALEEITGEDRQLHENNQGRYGYRGTGPNSKKRVEYWRIARDSVKNWDGASMVIVNVSDFIYSKLGVDHTEPVVAEWDNLLKEFGWQTYRVPVGTRRMRHGANSDKRVPAEWILVGSKR